jgi:hypothetical protein
MIMEFKAKSILKPTFVWQKVMMGEQVLFSIYYHLLKGDEIVAESDRYKIILKETGNHEYYAALEVIMNIYIF